MTKTEPAKRVAAQAGLTGGQAKTVVDAVFHATAAELSPGGDVAIAALRRVQGRRARRPAGPQAGDGGETMQIAASRGAKSSAAAALKRQLSG